MKDYQQYVGKWTIERNRRIQTEDGILAIRFKELKDDHEIDLAEKQREINQYRRITAQQQESIQRRRFEHDDFVARSQISWTKLQAAKFDVLRANDRLSKADAKMDLQAKQIEDLKRLVKDSSGPCQGCGNGLASPSAHRFVRRDPGGTATRRQRLATGAEAINPPIHFDLPNQTSTFNREAAGEQNVSRLQGVGAGAVTNISAPSSEFNFSFPIEMAFNFKSQAAGETSAAGPSANNDQPRPIFDLSHIKPEASATANESAANVFSGPPMVNFTETSNMTYPETGLVFGFAPTQGPSHIQESAATSTPALKADQEMTDAEWSKIMEDAFDEIDDSRVMEYEQARLVMGEVDDDELLGEPEEENVAQGAADGNADVNMVGTYPLNGDELYASASVDGDLAERILAMLDVDEPEMADGT